MYFTIKLSSFFVLWYQKDSNLTNSCPLKVSQDDKNLSLLFFKPTENKCFCEYTFKVMSFNKNSTLLNLIFL